MKTKTLCTLIALSVVFAAPHRLAAQSTAFTYQGRLDANGAPVNGSYDLRFALYDAVGGGNLLLPGAVTNTAVAVSNGLFTVAVDFGSVPANFNGSPHWLDIGVRSNGSGDAFVTLVPRQELRPTPYAFAARAGAVTNGSVTAAQLQTTGAAAAGQILTFDGSSLVWQNPAAASGAWAVGGNSAVGGNFLGTLNNFPLDLRANNARALRLEPNATSPNVIAGWSGNSATPGIMGGTVGGGGAQLTFGRSSTNKVTDDFCTVSGGANNIAGNDNGVVNDSWYATIGGGQFNRAEGVASTISGGSENHTANNDTTVGGGYQNTASGIRAVVGGGWANTASGSYATISGGQVNTNSADFATVAGGLANTASGSGAAVAGGVANIASGTDAVVPGGVNNLASGSGSFAAGANAQALHNGSFVWADSQSTPPPFPMGIPFPSVAANEFAVRAKGGARFQTTFLRVSGAGNEDAYIGGDGVGGEVHVGSLNPAVNKVAVFNSGGGFWMDLYVRSLTIVGGADLAEPFEMSSANIQKGSVVVIDAANPGRLKLSTKAYDKRVAGVVSGANGVNPGIAMRQAGVLEGGQNVALSGRVYVQAEASSGSIEPGDLLTTADTPGHAMKVADHSRAQGAILGKAMSGLKTGQGTVLVLVTLQ